MDASALIATLADTARVAARTLTTASAEERKFAVLAIADEIEKSSARIIAANEEDLNRGRAEGMHPQLLDRLLLNPARVEGIANGARQVAQLPSPLGITLRESTMANGLHLQQVSVPFGVVGMVYEARPNVTVDAAVILLMSGNAALLRGSSSAASSNSALVAIMRDALARTSGSRKCSRAFARPRQG